MQKTFGKIIEKFPGVKRGLGEEMKGPLFESSLF
jgi:hypothetical protein